MPPWDVALAACTCSRERDGRDPQRDLGRLIASTPAPAAYRGCFMCSSPGFQLPASSFRPTQPLLCSALLCFALPTRSAAPLPTACSVIRFPLLQPCSAATTRARLASTTICFMVGNDRDGFAGRWYLCHAHGRSRCYDEHAANPRNPPCGRRRTTRLRFCSSGRLRQSVSACRLAWCFPSRSFVGRRCMRPAHSSIRWPAS